MPTYEITLDGKPRQIELTRHGEKSFTAKIDNEIRKIEIETGRLDLTKQFHMKVDGVSYRIWLSEISRQKPFSISIEGISFKAEIAISRKQAFTAFEPTRLTPTKKANANRSPIAEGAITAPMTGRVMSVKIKKGDAVKAGQVLCVIEAMKMENEIAAPKTGIVQEVNVAEGSPVSEGQALFVVG